MVDESQNYRFGEFLLDVRDRQLWKDGRRLSLSARYLDTLILLVSEHGQLVGKDRLFDEVWDDVVVSDSALTQCIKEIRKQLGDDAASPTYIQTVPRHGYRFIAAVEPSDGPVAPLPKDHAIASGMHEPSAHAPHQNDKTLFQQAIRWSVAGMLGGGLAGLFGGVLYGSVLGYAPVEDGLGTASIMLVVLSINVFVGLVGAFGICAGMAALRLISRRSPGWSIVGGATGGLLAGGLTKLLGVDAFTLFFGLAPAGITGGMEGAALGACLAMGVGLIQKLSRSEMLASKSLWPVVGGGGIACGLAGALIPIAGGHLMGGSLNLLARSFPDTRLDLAAIGHIFGEPEFGVISESVLGGVEGLLFGCCVAGAIHLSQTTSDVSKA